MNKIVIITGMYGANRADVVDELRNNQFDNDKWEHIHMTAYRFAKYANPETPAEIMEKELCQIPDSNLEKAVTEWNEFVSSLKRRLKNANLILTGIGDRKEIEIITQETGVKPIICAITVDSQIRLNRLSSGEWYDRVSNLTGQQKDCYTKEAIDEMDAIVRTHSDKEYFICTADYYISDKDNPVALVKQTQAFKQWVQSL